MKTHLPHRLRAALVAALASVSIATAYGADTDKDMKVTEDTCFPGDSPIEKTGTLTVTSGKTLNVEYHQGVDTIASFTEVHLEDGSTMICKTNDHYDEVTIQSLSGSGTLKIDEGSGTTMSVKDASQFTGDIEMLRDCYLNLEFDKTNLATPKEGGRTVYVRSEGAVNLIGLDDGADAAFTLLHLSSGAFGVYKSGSADPGTDKSNVGDLTMVAGSKILLDGAGCFVRANLNTKSGSILDLSKGGGICMDDVATVNMEAGTIIALTEYDFDTLANGGTITLFYNVLEGANTDMAASDLVICRGGVGGEKLQAQVSFYLVDKVHQFWPDYRYKNGVLSLASAAPKPTTPTPEPTTGTLSLLALASLCARRRRKD